MSVKTQGRKWVGKFVVAIAIFITPMLSNCSSGYRQSNVVYVLLYDIGAGNQDIHIIDTDTTKTVLMFDSKSAASSFSAQLEAQDFPRPTVEKINLEELLDFCRTKSYICKLVPDGVTILPPVDNASPVE